MDELDQPALILGGGYPTDDISGTIEACEDEAFVYIIALTDTGRGEGA